MKVCINPVFHNSNYISRVQEQKLTNPFELGFVVWKKNRIDCFCVHVAVVQFVNVTTEDCSIKLLDVSTTVHKTNTLANLMCLLQYRCDLCKWSCFSVIVYRFLLLHQCKNWNWNPARRVSVTQLKPQSHYGLWPLATTLRPKGRLVADWSVTGRKHWKWSATSLRPTGRDRRIGRALISHAGDPWFEPIIESNQWLIKLILIAS